MKHVLAVDAGGTSTRAVLARQDGSCLGVGRGGGGNPVSVGPQAAMESVVTAAGQAALAAGGPVRVELVLVAMAGMSAMLPVESMVQRLAEVGVQGPVRLGSDLLAMFCSGTPQSEGYALVGGTGSIAARVAGERTVRIAGGNGWLLGDVGSGFWLGQQVARAVVADLDGLGPATALTGMLLDALAVAETGMDQEGRPLNLVSLVDKLYRLRPVELAQFAPMAFAAEQDPVARQIRRVGAEALVELLAATYIDGLAGPVVIGGSVARRMFADPDSALAGSLAGREVTPVDDGLAGSAVMALRQCGFPMDQAVFDRINADIARLRS